MTSRRIMPTMRSIVVSIDRCTGCRACLLACSSAHGEGFSPRRARLWIDKDDLAAQDRPIICRHCSDPACVSACPRGALIRNELGALELDKGNCERCGLCICACPYGALRSDPETLMPMPCDLCHGSPACVRVCVVGALSEEP